MRDDKHFGVAQFMRDCILLRDTADRNSGCCAMLSRNELSCILDYLATTLFLYFLFLFFSFLLFVLNVRFDYE